MGKSIYARKPKRVTTLEAISWWAKEHGTTYGKLSAILSEEETNCIFEKYKRLCEDRQEKERLRLGWQ